MSNIAEITAEAFEQEVTQHQGRVLIDFYAPWCGPCKVIAPVIEHISEEFQQLKVIKINADNAQELMAKFGIRGIPTLLLLEDGELKDTNVGAASISQVRAFVSA